jgi:hypothetical protein
MKPGLLYSILVLVTLLIVSTEFKDKEKVSDVTSTCRLIDSSIHNDCVTVAGNNSLKKLNPVFVRFRFAHERILRRSYDQKIQQALIKQHLRQSMPDNLQGIKPDALIILNYSTEKENYHHLL